MNNQNGVTFEMSSIDTAALISGQPYQRPIREGRLQELTRKWNPGLLDPLVVSYRDGKFYLVDGQHRVVIQRRMHGGDFKAPCKLYHGLPTRYGRYDLRPAKGMNLYAILSTFVNIYRLGIGWSGGDRSLGEGYW